MNKVRLQSQWEYGVVQTNDAHTAARPSTMQVAAWHPCDEGCLPESAHSDLAQFLPAIGWDAHTVLMRTTCSIPNEADTLVFEGLAGLVDVYWNDTLLARSESMFIPLEIKFTQCDAIVLNGQTGVLSLQFHSLHTALQAKRPRPRWKTRLVTQQGLRWHRQTLLGRIPGWAARNSNIGIYRDIYFNCPAPSSLTEQQCFPRVMNGHAELHYRFVWQAADVQNVQLTCGGYRTDLPCEQGHSEGVVRHANWELWWPHTHGTPNLYDVSLSYQSQGQTFVLPLERVGFRSLETQIDESAFHIHINGQKIFARGTCWMPPGGRIDASELAWKKQLLAYRDAGFNMVRLVGTTIYERDAFYRYCDQLGLMVWQDFMFANFDYPFSDETFLNTVQQEARYFLARTQARACLTVLCGNSEIEQQASMLGQEAAMWRAPFFAETLAQICSHYRPDCLYVPSSPYGGTVPFQVNQGVSHYFGVGAYKRDLSDARLADPKFISEGLGFSNYPNELSLRHYFTPDAMTNASLPWYQGMPRDNGCDWDFADITHHYVERNFAQYANQLKCADPFKYRQLCRYTSADVMARCVAIWRRYQSSCQGILTWFGQDLYPGAGWGLLDVQGQPKAAYYAMQRACATRTVFIRDEGMNGLKLDIINESRETMHGSWRVSVYLQGHVRAHIQTEHAFFLPAHNQCEVDLQAHWPYFFDASYAYRFGAPSFSVIHVELIVNEQVIAEDHFFPQGSLTSWVQTQSALLSTDADSDVTQPVEQHEPIESPILVEFCHHQGRPALSISSKTLIFCLEIESKQACFAENYFHMMPGSTKIVTFKDIDARYPVVSGRIQAINLPEAQSFNFSL